MKSGVLHLREGGTEVSEWWFKKIQQEPRLLLDIPKDGGTIDESPPIRFRIEWAGGQGLVTASWQSAHFNFQAILSAGHL